MITSPPVFANSVYDPAQSWTEPANAVGPVTANSASIPVGSRQWTPPMLFGFDLSALGIHPASTIDSIAATAHARSDATLDPNVGIALYYEGVPVQTPEHVGVLATVEPWSVTIGGLDYQWGTKLNQDLLANLVVGVNAYAFNSGTMYIHAVSVVIQWTPPDAGEVEPL